MTPPMTPPTRSLLRLDLKDLGSRPSTPVLSHLGLASVTAGALLITYALINGLSASTAEAPLGAADPATPEITGIAEYAPPAKTPEAETITLASLGPARAGSDFRRDLPGHHAPPPEADAVAAQPPVISLPEAESEPKPVVAARYLWTTATVKPRDTLSRIFKRHGLKIRDAYAAAELEDAAILRKIRPGAEIRLAADDSGALAALRYRLDAFTTLHVTKTDGRLRAETITRTPEIRVRSGKATIWTNLLDAAKGVGMEFETVYAIAQLFGWQVDFAREIRGGDQFSVLYEELYLDNRKVGNGDILAAELVISNRHLRAVRHVDAQGRSTHYAPNGDGIQRSFLRSPLKFGRVTSRFSHKRFHPIFKKWRAHRGVDYGAPRGTPVLSTGDGVVSMARHDHGYGKTIRIRHGGKYTTLYAHLNGFAAGMKSGVRVQQGEVIGYVGSSGWATGPHLHYEFRVDGVHRNPLTVKLPKSAPIARQHLREFLAHAGEWIARLEQIRALPGAAPVAAIDVAQNDAAQ